MTWCYCIVDGGKPAVSLPYHASPGKRSQGSLLRCRTPPPAPPETQYITHYDITAVLTRSTVTSGNSQTHTEAPFSPSPPWPALRELFPRSGSFASTEHRKKKKPHTFLIFITEPASKPENLSATTHAISPQKIRDDTKQHKPHVFRKKVN